MISGIERVGQVFRTKVSQRIFVVIGQEHHEESNQEVWTTYDLETSTMSVASEGYLQVLERSDDQRLA